MKKCNVCDSKHHAKGLCERCYRKKYMREYQQRPEVKAKVKKYSQQPEVKARINKYQREYYKKNKGKRLFSWDDMAALIRKHREVDITTLTYTQQKVFRGAARKNVISLIDDIARPTALTHALDGYVEN